MCLLVQNACSDSSLCLEEFSLVQARALVLVALDFSLSIGWYGYLIWLLESLGISSKYYYDTKEMYKFYKSLFVNVYDATGVFLWDIFKSFFKTQ